MSHSPSLSAAKETPALGAPDILQIHIQIGGHEGRDLVLETFESAGW